MFRVCSLGLRVSRIFCTDFKRFLGAERMSTRFRYLGFRVYIGFRVYTGFRVQGLHRV